MGRINKQPCQYLIEDLVNPQHNNVTLHIQKSVSENTQNAVLRLEKYKLFFTNNLHLSSLYTQYRMVPFCRCPLPHPLPLTDKFLEILEDGSAQSARFRTSGTCKYVNCRTRAAEIINPLTLFHKTSSRLNTKDSLLSLVTMEPANITIINFKMVLSTFMATANCIKDRVAPRKLQKSYPRRNCNT
jgi:Mg2+ and Co2+ transporter CorA